MTGIPNPTGKQGLIRCESCFSHSGGDGISRMSREFELDRMPGLSLDEGRSGLQGASMGNVTHAQYNGITPAQLAVNSQIEQR